VYLSHEETKDWGVRRPKLRAATRFAAKSVPFVLGFIVLLVFFAPAVLTLSWHLRNGSFVVYKGRSIKVPLRWTAKVEPQGTLLMKFRWTVFARPPFLSWIFFDPSPYQTSTNPDAAITSWEAFYWTSAAKTDGTVSGPLVIRSANETICMKTVSKGNPDVASAECLIFQPILSAHFGGESKDLGTFFQILGGIK
jgi:hypothetical protein